MTRFDLSSDGHELIFLFGPARFVPAHFVIVHVDLRVVPDGSLELAARFSIAQAAARRHRAQGLYAYFEGRP